MGILEGRERTGFGMIKDSVSYIHSQTTQVKTMEFKKEKALVIPTPFFPELAFFNCNITETTKLESIQDVFFL